MEILSARAPINFRSFLVIAVFVTAAVFCAYGYMFNRAVGVVLACILIISLVIVAICLTLKFVRGRAKLRTVIAFAVSAVFCTTAFSIASVTYDNWNKNPEYGGLCTVYGRVCAADTRTGDYKFDLEDLSINGREVSGILRIAVSASDRNVSEIIDYGDYLSFDAYISAAKLIDDGAVNGNAYRTDIRYYATVRSENIKIDFGTPTVLERFSRFLHRLYTDNMGDKYGNIAFSMVTGDKHALDVNVSDYFSAAGLGHIMAVSGLHIGFLTLLLNFVLLRLNRKIRFPIISAVLIAYAVLADFSPSVVRAVIMALISMFAVFVGGRRDILSSTACAYSAILAVKPLYLFDVGFLLSFGAIFGIAMFANSISRFLTRHNASKKVGDSFGAAVSVQAGITPTQIYYFHKFQPLALIANIALIPYISLVFITIICFTPIAAIPHCGAILKASEYLLLPLDYIAYGISHVPYSNITVYCTAAVFLCYPVMFSASEYFMIPKCKAAIAMYSAAAYIAFCGINIPALNNAIVAVACSDNTSILCVNECVYVVGYAYDSYELHRALERSACKRIDGIFLFDINMRTVDSIVELDSGFEIGAVYCDKFNTAAEILIDNGIDYFMETAENEYALNVAYVGGEKIGYEYNSVLFAKDGVDEAAFSVYDVVRVRTVENPRRDTVYLCNYSDASGDNIFTLENGSYCFEL